MRLEPQQGQHPDRMGEQVDTDTERPEFGRGFEHLALNTLAVQCKREREPANSAASDEDRHRCGVYGPPSSGAKICGSVAGSNPGHSITGSGGYF
jgi:hypothetical protein